MGKLIISPGFSIEDIYAIFLALFNKFRKLQSIRLSSVRNLNSGDDSIIAHGKVCFIPEKFPRWGLVPETRHTVPVARF